MARQRKPGLGEASRTQARLSVVERWLVRVLAMIHPFLLISDCRIPPFQGGGLGGGA